MSAGRNQGAAVLDLVYKSFRFQSRHPADVAEAEPVKSCQTRMSESTQFVVFTLAKQRYGLPLAAVERIVRAVEVTALPDAPAVVLGVIDVGGRVLPVFNLRRRFQLPEQALTPAEQLIVAQTARRTVALRVDEVNNVLDHPTASVVEAPQVVPGASQIQGVVKLPDGLVLIHDLEKFLSQDEARRLEEAMDRKAAHAS